MHHDQVTKIAIGNYAIIKEAVEKFTKELGIAISEEF